MSEYEFETGSFELTTDPEQFLIPKRTGTSIFLQYDGSECCILFSVIAQTYQDQAQATHIYAINQSMAVGIITQLAQALEDAGVPTAKTNRLMKHAAATLHIGRQTN